MMRDKTRGKRKQIIRGEKMSAMHWFVLVVRKGLEYLDRPRLFRKD